MGRGSGMQGPQAGRCQGPRTGKRRVWIQESSSSGTFSSLENHIRIIPKNNFFLNLFILDHKVVAVFDSVQLYCRNFDEFRGC